MTDEIEKAELLGGNVRGLCLLYSKRGTMIIAYELWYGGRPTLALRRLPWVWMTREHLSNHLLFRG